MLVGINGLKGVGKNTVGNYLVDSYGFEERSFAKLLKESAAALFDIHPDQWEVWKNLNNMRVVIGNEDHPDETESNISVREFLQRYGTEAHRNVFGDNFWVDYAMKGIDPNKDIVFTDARFENELQRIKTLGGYNLQVLRPGLFTEDRHVSEVSPPQHLIDFAVDNVGSFNDLYNQVDAFIEWLDEETGVSATYGDWRDNPGNYGE